MSTQKMDFKNAYSGIDFKKKEFHQKLKHVWFILRSIKMYSHFLLLLLFISIPSGILTLFRMGLFGAADRWGGRWVLKGPLS